MALTGSGDCRSLRGPSVWLPMASLVLQAVACTPGQPNCKDPYVYASSELPAADLTAVDQDDIYLLGTRGGDLYWAEFTGSDLPEEWNRIPSLSPGSSVLDVTSCAA